MINNNQVKIDKVLTEIARQYESILGNNLVGIYVHGSLAFGCFNSRKSDIDFIVVVNRKPAIEEKEAMIKLLLELSSEVPEKGFEMSVVLAEVCERFIYPTPFELHYSAMHMQWCKEDLRKYCTTMKGTDKDLAAHFTVIKTVGYVIAGQPIAKVFGEVPRSAYLDSIELDVKNAVEEIYETPVYIILNLCRVLAFKKDGLILSKEQGGIWGMKNLDEKYEPLITEALKAYRDEENVDFNEQASLSFCNYMIEKIFKV
ncbi:MAG: DUF4111 domain-containing protein [Clostridium sp.]